VDRVPDLLSSPGTALADYVRHELLDPLPEAARRLLWDAAHLGNVCADLLDAAVDIPTGTRTAGTLTSLIDTGLLLPAGLPDGTYRFAPDAPPGPWARPVPLVAAIARRTGPVPDTGDRRRWRAAAQWCHDHRLHGHAARLFLAAGDADAGARVLRAHGEQVVAAGGAAVVTAVARDLPPELRDDRVRLVYAEALAVQGENDLALAELTALAGPTGPVDPGVAWRQGAVHHQRAERDAALAALARGRTGTLRTRDEAFLLAHTAIVHWSLGAVDQCRAMAERSMRVATAAGDERALSAARVALALHAMLVGDRVGNAAQYEQAAQHAERAGDEVHLARIRVNQVSILLEEARFPEARQAGAIAVAAAEAAGNPAILAGALINHAEALTRLGHLAEAERCLHRAVAIYQRTGSRKVAYPLASLGDLHASRGAWELARASYEEAVRVADADGFVQCLVPALSGLATLAAGEDQATSRLLAERAVTLATGPMRTRALLAVGRVALAGSDRAAADGAARSAAASARQHRDRAGVACALELQAAAADTPEVTADVLREAARTWQGTGAQLDADRVVVLLGRLPGAAVAERLAGTLAAARLADAGAVVPGRPAVPEVVVRTLGRFEVVVGGEVVSNAGWQSRKARDLLRILIARRGRTVPREELGALLWADDDPQRVAHRLSVALSTLRSVLDPGRQAPTDHYIVAGSGGVRVDLAHLRVDVESYVEEAAYALRCYQRGEPADAHPALAAVASSYTEDFCEDEPYQDWSAQTREEARAVHLRVLRALAATARTLGRTDEAVGWLLRILHHDRYDQGGHRDLVELLVSAGRHGEARRARSRYRAAMDELGVAPVDDRGLAA
jgi:DNA-binding SARP family transcriptional activator